MLEFPSATRAEKKGLVMISRLSVDYPMDDIFEFSVTREDETLEKSVRQWGVMTIELEIF